jgi:hypothetical protein
MSRFSALFVLALAAIPASVLAADPQITLVTTPNQVHAKIVASANLVCTQARADDPLDDFGTQEECVDNTIRGAVVRPATASVMASGAR